MGVQILNKDVSLISSVLSKPKANIGSIFGVTGWAGSAIDTIPNPTPNWDNLQYDAGTGEYIYSSQQIQGINTPITLRLTYDSSIVGEVYYNINSSEIFVNTSFPPTQQDQQETPFTRILSSETLTVSNNQWICFGLESNAIDGVSTTVSVNNLSDGAALLDQFDLSNINSCYLTTATVQYKGLSDNGPELTAMRLLREYYRGDVYYDNLITEYYQNSPIIINGINNGIDPASEYEFIYQSVLRVRAFVDLGQWEEAKDEYINTYILLKNKYI